MGASASTAAKGLADKQLQELDQMMKIIINRRDAMLSEMTSARGDATMVSKTEVAGGRSVMRTSQVRVAAGTDIASDIQAAIGDFFAAAQGAIDDKKTQAKHAAVKGAQNLLTAGLEALMGVSKGQSMEVKDFVVLFMNNSFVRCDYYAYSYSASAKAWGVETHKCGACYVTDLAVLDPTSLSAQEIDYLLSQALHLDYKDFSLLNSIKVSMIESSVLNKMLLDAHSTFADVEKIVQQLSDCHNKLEKSLADLKNYSFV